MDQNLGTQWSSKNYYIIIPIGAISGTYYHTGRLSL
jgi:hypothetical protein